MNLQVAISSRLEDNVTKLFLLFLTGGLTRQSRAPQARRQNARKPSPRLCAGTSRISELKLTRQLLYLNTMRVNPQKRNRQVA